jgi:hypothetical protein
MNPASVIIVLVVLWAVAYWVLSMSVGYLIGKRSGHPAAGFWLGFFFTAIGWIVVYFLPVKHEYAVAAEINRRRVAADADRSIPQVTR